MLCFIQGDSIKCWVCRSDGDPKCADPFDNKSFPITDCKIEKDRKHLGNLKATMCRKVRQKGNTCVIWMIFLMYIYITILYLVLKAKLV